MVRSSLAAVTVATLSIGAVGCMEEPPPVPASTVDASYDAAPYLDEDFLKTNDFAAQTRRRAQVFTVGRTGTLDKISAILGQAGSNPIVPVTITVQSLDGSGKPSGTVLGEGVWSGPALPDPDAFSDVPLTDTAEVVAGQQYALVFDNPAPTSVSLRLDSPDYPDGVAFENFTVGTTTPSWLTELYREVPFKTWVR